MYNTYYSHAKNFAYVSDSLTADGIGVDKLVQTFADIDYNVANNLIKPIINFSNNYTLNTEVKTGSIVMFTTTDQIDNFLNENKREVLYIKTHRYDMIAINGSWPTGEYNNDIDILKQNINLSEEEKNKIHEMLFCNACYTCNTEAGWCKHQNTPEPNLLLLKPMIYNNTFKMVIIEVLVNGKCVTLLFPISSAEKITVNNCVLSKEQYDKLPANDFLRWIKNINQQKKPLDFVPLVITKNNV
jgi:hypothetical protein